MTIGAGGRLEDLACFGFGLDHLPECPHSSVGPVGGCDWCRWAILTPELESLLVVNRDARTLLRDDGVDTIAGIVAAARLFEIFDEADLDRIDVASARQVASRIGCETARHLDQLRRAVARATAGDGPIDRRCRRTAGALAAAALQSEHGAPRAASLPVTLRTRLDQISRDLSGEVQLASLLPVIDHLHWRGLPELISQPEWARRPRPDDSVGLRRRQLVASGTEPGSLEALVVEAVIDRCTEGLLEFGELLGAAKPPVTYCRDGMARPFGGAVRATLWRVLRIDWHATLIDSELAACWGARTIGGVRRVVVPWYVDVAVQALMRLGHRSALFQDAPSRSVPGSGEEPSD